MWTKLAHDIASRHLVVSPTTELTTEAELAGLPTAVRAYLAFYGVVASQPKHWSMRMAWTGRFRMGRERPWMPIEAVQYDTRTPVARVFHMRARMSRIVPVLARDTYVDGRGHMLAKIADLLPVANGSGPEFDRGELVTWVNDCVFFAPSMLLGPSTRWTEVDAHSFDVTFSDRGCAVTARVSIDERGAPVDFETTDRYLNDPDDPKHPLVRGRWSTPMQAWRTLHGRSLPSRGQATWRLPSGDLTYAEFELKPDSLAFDVAPSDLAGAQAA